MINLLHGARLLALYVTVMVLQLPNRGQSCDKHRKCGDGDAMCDAAKPILMVCDIRIVF
jgi:hypothetical protein